MVKTLFDPKVKLEGIIEGKKNGFQEGIQEGIQQGAFRGKKEAILELLQDLGFVSDSLKDTIELETDLERVRKWVKLAARVNSADEFAAKMNQ